MADVHDIQTRSRNMAAVRGKDTMPELIVRKSLHKLGFRYKLHDKDLPGKPDLVFPRYNAVIQINGCFWHRHDCHFFKWPSTRREFWRKKLTRNNLKDTENLNALKSTGWRVLTIWECALKGRERQNLTELIEDVAYWLNSGSQCHVIEGSSIRRT